MVSSRLFGERVVNSYRNSKLYTDIVFYPNNSEHKEENREFQCGPAIAVTQKGRLFFAWEAGGYMEPCNDQYLILRYSDDFGKTLSDDILEINFNKEYNIHVSDSVLWIDPLEKLHVFWCQEDATPYDVGHVPKYFYNSKGQRWCAVDGLLFKDFLRCTWEIVCDNPNEKKLKWSKPRSVFDGNMINPPIVLKSGRWVYPSYISDEETISYYISDNKGKTFVKKTGGKMLKTQCAETSFYEGNEGEIVFLQRSYGKLGKAISCDNAESFGDAYETEIYNCNTKATSLKLSNGHILICNNDVERLQVMEETNNGFEISEADFRLRGHGEI